MNYSNGAMPKSIAEAIITVQKQVDSIQKKNRNQFAKYDYVSADDLYAFLTHKLAEAGLVILPVERSQVEIIQCNGEDHALFNFGFILCVGEDTFDHADLNRSMFIKVTGPQTFGAAESYLQKSFLRGLFKIPTGDHDLDEVAPEKPAKAKKPAKAPKLPEKAQLEVIGQARAFLEENPAPLGNLEVKIFVEQFGKLAPQLSDENADELRNMLKEARNAKDK